MSLFLEVLQSRITKSSSVRDIWKLYILQRYLPFSKYLISEENCYFNVTWENVTQHVNVMCWTAALHVWEDKLFQF